MNTLYLIPTTISADTFEHIVPAYTLDKVKGLKIFICENAKTARNHLKDALDTPIQNVSFLQIDKHKKYTKNELLRLTKPLLSGKDVGLITEAGCPAVADPGHEIVLFCHQNNIKVVPLIGPSSLLMALMASGLNGQHFKFVGYLNKNTTGRKKEIKNLEQESKKRETAIIIMETPYRGEYVWKDLVFTCKPNTLLTLAMDITTKSEFIKTARAEQWKNMKWPKFNKNQTIFLLQAPA